MNGRYFRAVVALAAAVLVAGPAIGQGVQTATLIGTVTDPDGSPLPGVTITASSPVLLGQRVTVSAGNGDYIVRGLPPGNYTVQFTLGGMQDVEMQVSLPLGVQTRADAQLELATVEETIVVTGEAPSALTNITVGANFDDDLINSLPVGRTPTQIASLAGAVTGKTPVGGQLSINGGMAYDNSFLVNGVNVQDPIFGQTNNLFIEDAVQETQLLTSGISAEYGAFTGGVLNVITKSGGNEFSGSARVNFSKPEWRDETPFEDEQGVEREGDLAEFYEATFGGPIMRDHIWFFLAGRDVEDSRSETLAVSGDSYSFLEENTRYEVKLTGNIAANHSVQGSYIDNPVERNFEAQVAPLEIAALGVNSERENDGFVVSYSGVLTNNLFAEARYSEKAFAFVNLGGTSTDIFDSPFRSSTRFAGNTSGTYNAPYFDATDPENRDNDQLYGALSYFLSTDRAGSHDFKLGAESFTVTRTGGNSQTSTDFVFYTGYKTDAAGNPVKDPSGRLIPIFNSASAGRLSDDSRIGLWLATRGSELDITTDAIFLNDRWTLNDHWSFNIGVRHEIVDSEATGDIISVDTDTTVPRLGVSFDPKGDGKYKFDVTYAEYAGRYNPAISGENTPVGNPSLLYGYYVGPSGEGRDFAPGFDPNNYAFYYASVPTGNVFMASGLSSPVQEEITLSAGMALPEGGYLKATYIDRDLTGVIDDFITIDLGCSDIELGGIDAGCIDNKLYENTDEPERTYQAILLQGRYRLTSNWQLEGNYTYQLENDGNYEGEGGQAIGASPFGDFPETQSPRVFPTGHLAQYQEHKVRLWTTYNFDLGRAGDLAAGVIYRHDSPQTFSFSTSVPLSDIQRARNPGYQALPGAQTLFFGPRGAGEFDSSSLFDVSLLYAVPVFKRVEPWVKIQVNNVFNDDSLIEHNTGIAPDFDGPSDADGLPLNFFPGSSFGRATDVDHYVVPREYLISAGIRF